MTAPHSVGTTTEDSRTSAWVGPFAVFALWLMLDDALPLANPGREILRDGVLLAAIVFFSRKVIPTRAPHWLASVGVGLGVFLLWIAPDTLIEGWRNHWIFQNSVVGHSDEAIRPEEFTPLMLALRTARAVLLVPIIEELFWRGWLVRWLQDHHFTKVPIGQFTRLAFWGTALLFAAEHGSFWEVGLLAGIVYNWWLRRSRSLGDLVIAHAVTNLALSVYVMWSGRFGFWM